MGKEVSCLFCVSEMITPLVTSYYGRQSIAKLTAQPYFMIVDWLLIALSHTVQTSEQLKNIRFCIAYNIQGLSLLNTTTTSLPTRSNPAAKIFSRNLEVCT